MARGGIGEVKQHNFDVTDAVVGSGMIVQAHIMDIPQGVTSTQRIGQQVTIRNIGFRFSIKLPSTSTLSSSSDNVRVMFVQDKQANGALPANTDVLFQDDMLSFNNLNNKHRFRTLFDRVYTLSASGVGGDGTTDKTGEDIVYDTFYKKVNMKMEYSSSTGDIGEVKSNNYFVVLGSTDGLCAFDGKLRIRFSDA